ncbi:MAG: YihY/virulence factor BrkB family protein [Nocardioides sp.]
MPRPTARTLMKDLATEVGKDRVLGLAAEVAFFTVLSLFPGLLVAAGLLSYLEIVAGADVASRTQEQVTTALSQIFDNQANEVTTSVETILSGRYGGLLTVATIGALVTLSGAWAVVIEALNHAYDIEEQRSWVRRRFLGLVLGGATALVVVASLAVVVVGPLLGRGEDVADVVGLGPVFVWLWDAARFPILFVVVTAWLAFVFHVAPNRRTPWRASLPGSLVTSILWLLATLGFSIYVRVVAESSPLLGALGGGVILLTWVYLLSIALLLGGEVNAILYAHRLDEDPGQQRSSNIATS